MKKVAMVLAFTLAGAAFAEDECKVQCDKVIKDLQKGCKEKTQGRGDIIKMCLDEVKKMEKTCVQDCHRAQ